MKVAGEMFFMKEREEGRGRGVSDASLLQRV
jgi:hypothetical protein